MQNNKKTTLLCILDGFGINPNPVGNAVAQAKKPNFDRLWQNYPHATLTTFGPRVGLPEGQMGNSEVGHLNIGAGRVVEQSLFKISRALSANFLKSSDSYQNFLAKKSKQIHLFGLCSDGGVHAHYEHLLALINWLEKDCQSEILLHLICDGRDTAPNSGLKFVSEIESFCKTHPRCKIASVIGRFFAMDRDQRWERTQKAFDLYYLNKGQKFDSACEALNKMYAEKITDEFIEPCVINSATIQAKIQPNDALIFWNFRADRMRQLVAALSLDSFSGFKRDIKNVKLATNILCFTEYDKNFKLPFLFSEPKIENYLGEVVSKAGLTQLRIAETEKYAHVTYFLNAGSENVLAGEERIMIPSPKEVKTYDLKPEMSADLVCKAVVESLESQKFDLIVLNFANPDMVGHTGVLAAGIKAVEKVDECLGKIIQKIDTIGGQVLVIADHGNCEQMINYEDNTPHTSHTKFPVPVIFYPNYQNFKMRTDGALCDVAPSVLKVLGLQVPSEMTGQSLLI